MLTRVGKTKTKSEYFDEGNNDDDGGNGGGSVIH